MRALAVLVPFAIACSSAAPVAPKAPGSASRVEVAAEEADDCVSPGDIQAALQKRNFAFQDCYQDGLAVDPTLSGTVTLEVVVPPSGRVERVVATESSVHNTKVVSCIEEVASNLEFRQSSCRMAQSVQYPVNLRKGSSEFALR